MSTRRVPSRRPAPPRPAPTIAVDGPAGSGKSTVAAAVAAALGIPHLDTGAFYRAITLACLRAGVDPADGEACAEVARTVDVTRNGGRTELDGEDVEDEIRASDVTRVVSAVSAHPGVRAAITPLQREAAAALGGVVEGRDIGTVVLPDADLKVFLTADVEERVRRRARQLGVPVDDALREDLARRDRDDTGRDLAPLVPADDAWVLDTSGLEVGEVVAAIVARATAVIGGSVTRRELPRVAIVGRPNVGKSTLLNRILGERVAIVEERPGVTRDRTEHVATWQGRPFVVLDTGGWEHGAEGMTARIVASAEAAIASADLVLFVVDVTVGALEDDERYARLLRRSHVPVLLVANKADGQRQEVMAAELYGLGLGDPRPVSARHGRGIGDLLDEVLAHLPEGVDHIPDEAPIPRVAIVGKPNVGKSSLFNRLVGEERSIVDPVPHTTRDAVDSLIELDGDPWIVVDTAGMRRHYRRGEDTELYSVDRTRRAVETADLVLFLIDASEPLGEQDQRLAALLRDAGRGVVLVCNKWDAVDEDRRADLERELDRLLHFARWAPRINVSALSGRGIRRVAPTLRTVWAAYTRRIPTRELNRVIEEATAQIPAPARGQGQLRVKYVTQAEVRPPRFVAFANGRIPPPYRRYLERMLRERYDFTGVPILIEERLPTPRDRAKRPRRR